MTKKSNLQARMSKFLSLSYPTIGWSLEIKCAFEQHKILMSESKMSTIEDLGNREIIKPEQVNPVASKKLYENFWRVLYLAIIAVAAVLFKKVYEYQTLPLYETIRKGSIRDLLIYSLPVMVVFTAIDHAVHYFDDWFLLNFINEAKYPDIEKRKKRCYTLTKWAFSQFYYLPVSVWAYFILLQTSYMPTWLGGKGNCIGMEQYFIIFDEATTEMKVFYMLQFGKHLSRFFSHVFIRAEGNFYEYALHHGLSTFLILFSYLTNMWLVGIMVLMFHDITDFVLIACRAYRDYKQRREWILKIFDVAIVILWLCGRIFFFSYCCVYSAFFSVYRITFRQSLAQQYLSTILWPGAFMVVMLACLQGLQIFWTYYIFSSFLATQVTSKIKHTYD